MIQLTIDGQQISVPAGTTVYTAAKQLGIDVPIFCYHDRMPPFGACRVCLVEIDQMGKLQTSCTLQALEGMVVKTQSAIAAEGRKEILGIDSSTIDSSITLKNSHTKLVSGVRLATGQCNNI